MSDQLFDVSGRSFIVAGAASGLGRAMACALAARGARLTLVDRARAPLEHCAAEFGTDVAIEVADITDESATHALMARAIANHGAIDGVINTAGLLRIAPAHELDLEQFKATLDVNVTGAFVLSRAAAKAMRGNEGRGKGGRIVHLASVSSRVANTNYAAYATSKAALSQLVRVLAREWAPDGITVNAIGPAMTETGMTGSYLSDSGFRERALAAIPMGRFGTPDDLIGPLVLLLSQAGAFITGQTLFIDGGRTLT